MPFICLFYIYTHTYLYTHMYLYTHTYLYTHPYTLTHIHTNTLTTSLRYVQVFLWYIKGRGSECITSVEVRNKPDNMSLAQLKNRAENMNTNCNR